MRILKLVQSFGIFASIKHLNNCSRNFATCKKMIYSFDFEVFGKVQGVYFRKYTKEEAEKLNIKGFVKNTDRNTVIGRAESDRKDCLEKFKNFLCNIGSPSSRIDKCVITNEQELSSYTTNLFVIRR